MNKRALRVEVLLAGQPFSSHEQRWEKSSAKSDEFLTKAKRLKVTGSVLLRIFPAASGLSFTPCSVGLMCHLLFEF